MNPDGFYDGWRDYMVTARPAFDGVTVTVTGKDYNGTKDYLGDLFHEILTREIDDPREQGDGGFALVPDVDGKRAAFVAAVSKG
jgi:hypothetical protein